MRPVPSLLPAAVIAVAVVLAPLPSTAQPAAGSPAAVTAGERNVYSAGAQVRPAGPIAGDFMGAGGRVIVDQAIGGDASLAGGAIDLRAPVTDDVRAIGGDVTIESSIGGELFASGGNVTLRPGASVARAAQIHAGNVVMEGRLDGELRASGQKVTINGEVRGDVRVTAGEVELGPQARLGGSLTYTSGSELKRAAGATVAGAVTRQAGDAAARPGSDPTVPAGPGARIAGAVMSYLALLACAAVFLLLVPVFSAHAAQRVRASPWLALAVGFGTLVAVPVLAVLLFLTLLGIPLGLAVLALYPVLLLAGFLVGVAFVARLLPPALRKPAAEGFRARIAWFALALLLVMLAGWVPVVGGIVLGLLTLAGIGACVLELYGRRKGHAAPAPLLADAAPVRSA